MSRRYPHGEQQHRHRTRARQWPPGSLLDRHTGPAWRGALRATQVCSAAGFGGCARGRGHVAVPAGPPHPVCRRVERAAHSAHAVAARVGWPPAGIAGARRYHACCLVRGELNSIPDDPETVSVHISGPTTDVSGAPTRVPGATTCCAAGRQARASRESPPPSAPPARPAPHCACVPCGHRGRSRTSRPPASPPGADPWADPAFRR